MPEVFWERQTSWVGLWREWVLAHAKLTADGMMVFLISVITIFLKFYNKEIHPPDEEECTLQLTQ